MVEPLEETRSELVFATEPVLSSLDLSIPETDRRGSLVELDEIEVCLCDSTYSATNVNCSLDSERHLANLQRPDVSSQLGTIGPFKPLSRKYYP